MQKIKTVAMLLGGIAILAQILLLRALMAIFCGNELLVGLALAVWMAFSALGSWIGNYLPVASPQRQLARALILMAIALAGAILGVALLPGSRAFLNVPITEYLSIRDLFILSPALLAPIALPLGASYSQLAAAASRNTGNPSALVYVWEAAGSVAGSILFTFVLLPRATPLQALLLAAMLALAAAAWSQSRKTWQIAAAGLLLILFIGAPGFENNRAAAYWRSLSEHMELRKRATSAYGELAVVDWGGATSLFSNGAQLTTLPNLIDAQAQAALLMNQPLPAPGAVLLVGGGLGGLAPELARYPDSHITYAEQDKKAFQLALAALPESLRTSWQNERLTVVHADGRHLLQRLDKKYAMIIINVGRPSGALANRFYTEEFFALARSRLAPDGILALLNVPGGENYLGPELLRLNRALYAGLGRLFARVAVIPGSDALFMASDGKGLTLEAAVLARRLQEKSLDLNYYYPQMFAQKLPADRIAEIERRLSAGAAWRNHDFRPIAYFIDLLLWQKMVQGGSRLLLACERIGYPRLLLIWHGLLAVWVIAALAGRSLHKNKGYRAEAGACQPGIVLAALAIGLAGIGFDVLFIMAMQNIFGSVYESIGLALAAFMAGMAGGGWISLRSVKARRGPLLAALLLLTACCAAGLTPLFAFLSRHPQQLLFYAALLGASGLVGGMFPLLCSLHGAGGPKEAWGTVYAADLAGGAFGALLISGVWVPLFGFSRTLVLVASACLAAALAIALCSQPLKKEADHV